MQHYVRDLCFHLRLHSLGTGSQAPMLPLQARQTSASNFVKICGGFHDRNKAAIKRKREHREQFVTIGSDFVFDRFVFEKN